MKIYFESASIKEAAEEKEPRKFNPAAAERSVGYGMIQNQDKLNTILNRLNAQEISFQQAGTQICDIIKSSEASDNQKKKYLRIITTICNGPERFNTKLSKLASSLASLETDLKVIRSVKEKG